MKFNEILGPLSRLFVAIEKELNDGGQKSIKDLSDELGNEDPIRILYSEGMQTLIVICAMAPLIPIIKQFENDVPDEIKDEFQKIRKVVSALINGNYKVTEDWKLIFEENNCELVFTAGQIMELRDHAMDYLTGFRKNVH